MNSMTGFGKAELTTKSGAFNVEISSVNNRFLEVSVRLPRQFSALEYRVRELVTSRLNRGKVFVFVGYNESDTSPGKYCINKKAIAAIAHGLREIREDLKIEGDIELGDLLVFQDVTRFDDADFDEKEIWHALEKVVTKALRGLLVMRRKEGAAMARDMRQRLKAIKQLNHYIEKCAPQLVDRYRERLKSRLAEMELSSAADPGRLEQEVAIIAERAEIAEECTRLYSHIAQYQNDLGQSEPVGKRLNFILQEMNREANTIASKASDNEITKSVISLKEEIEKLREMVQNIE